MFFLILPLIDNYLSSFVNLLYFIYSKHHLKTSNLLCLFLIFFLAFIEMPEMLYHLRKNYDYWKELHDKGLTGTEDPEKLPKNVKLEKVATKDFSVKEDVHQHKDKKINLIN